MAVMKRDHKNHHVETMWVIDEIGEVVILS